MHTMKKFIWKKWNLFDLRASLNEWELRKVKSIQTESVFFMILVKFFHRKNFINFSQKNFIECETLQIPISCEKFVTIIITIIIGSQ